MSKKRVQTKENSYEKQQSEKTCLGDIKIYYKVMENKQCDTGSQIYILYLYTIYIYTIYTFILYTDIDIYICLYIYI